MTTTKDVEDILRELTDTIRREPDLMVRAELVGTFRKSTTALRQELLAKTAYEMRDKRINLNLISSVLRARRSTIDQAVRTYCAMNHLTPPKGYQARTLDPDQIVTLPSREG